MTLYEKYENERKRVQAQMNQDIFKPISFEVFKKTDQEKGDFFTIKSKWNKSSLFGQTIYVQSFSNYKIVTSFNYNQP
jgi:hypothetical protein